MQEPEGTALPSVTAISEQVRDYIAKSDAELEAHASVAAAQQAFNAATEALAIARQASEQASVAFAVAWHDLTKIYGTVLLPGVYVLEDRALLIADTMPAEAPRPIVVVKL